MVRLHVCKGVAPITHNTHLRIKKSEGKKRENQSFNDFIAIDLNNLSLFAYNHRYKNNYLYYVYAIDDVTAIYRMMSMLTI